MANTRKKPSGFDSQVEESLSFEEQMEASSEEPEKEILEEKTKVVTPVVFVEESIMPTQDLGPRFTEEVPEERVQTKKAPELKPAPKRHPRNVPKFSRTR